MRNSIFPIGIACVAVVAFSTALAQDGETIDLSPTFVKGEKRVYESTNSQQMVLPGGEQTTDAVLVTSHEVVEKSKDGAKVKVTLSAMKMKIGRAGQVVEFDSAKPPTEGSLAATVIAPGVKAMLGKAVVYTADATGTVSKVEGLDVLQNGPGAQFFGAALEDESMKRQFSKMWAPGHPGKPVKVGDTWKTKEETQLQPGLSIAVELTHKAESVKDGVAKIFITGTAKISGDAKGGPKLEGLKASGSILWDQKKHVLKVYDFDQAMTLVLDNGGQKLKIGVRTHAVTKLVE